MRVPAFNCIATPAASCRIVGLLLAAGLCSMRTSALCAQSPAPSPEVRQIVTFLFQPGRTGDAFTIYEQQLKQIYTDIPSLRRFRAYREVESPEPLDLVVVSSYADMAAMDNANEALRRTQRNGQSALALYGVLSGMTQAHHDQFVEMIDALSDTATGGLTVLEYTRLAPGAHVKFEALLRARVRSFEKARGLYLWSETGRMLVSDGWDYLRLYGIRSLGDWQRYVHETQYAPFAGEVASLIAARKTIILRNDPRLSVR
ncbi:MAG: hypothetical protein ABI877_22330 [Gemmatimonadaceae bacterium]